MRQRRAPRFQKARNCLIVTGIVAQLRGVAKGEGQRFDGAVEADDANLARQIRSGSQHGEDVRGGAQANIPNNEFPRVRLQAATQLELIDIQRLRLGHRADHRMKRFTFRQRPDAVGAVRQTDELIIVRAHNLKDASSKLKSPSQLDFRPGGKLVRMRGMDPLLRLLQENAALKPGQLAKMLNLPESEVAAKIKAYEDEQVIVGYRAVLNEEKTGGDIVRAVIEVKITPERGGGFDRLAERIAKYTEVRSCYLMSGGFDLLVVVQGANLREVATFVSEKLATIQGVISTATHFMLKVYKDHGMMAAVEKNEERLVVSP
jgi:DNA-binding Lrp family transcriptional regulator